MNSNQVLNHEQIINKIRRIAYEILGSNPKEKEIILAGIEGNGYILTKRIALEILKINHEIKIHLCEVFMDKKNPLKTVKTSLSSDVYALKSLVLIDDVLHTGTTLIYGIKHFLEVPLKRFKTAILVNRNHKKYPVKADFKGLSLSTSIQENVEVTLENKNDFSVFLKNSQS